MPHTELDPAAHNALALIDMAIAEDLGTVGDLTGLDAIFEQVVNGDLTGRATIPDLAEGSAWFVARSRGVLAGEHVLELLCNRFVVRLGYSSLHRNGQWLDPGARFAHIKGSMRFILAMERTALNFLQRLSGIATLTAQFVEAVEGTKAVILDTRKTTPGWRHLEKYAVRCGGGKNHRIGLYDAVLIKDNHLAWLANEPDPIGRAIASARREAPPGTTVEVEIDDLDQFDRALQCGPDIILVDNLGPEKLAEAVRRRDARAPGILLEASGGVTLATVRALAETGVDRISVGALTHSAPSLDIGLDFDRAIVG